MKLREKLLKDLNILFFELDSKSRTLFLNVTQRIELFFECDSKIEIFDWKNSQQIELFPKKLWPKELNFFSQNDAKIVFSKIWFEEKNLLENMTHRIEFFIQKMTQRIEPFRNMTHRIEFFETKKTDRIEPFFSLTEVNPSFQHDSQYWTLLFNMTQKMIIFLIDSKKNWTGFLEYDSKNWAPFFSKMTRRIELFLEEWLKELNLVSKEKSQRVELFFLILK